MPPAPPLPKGGSGGFFRRGTGEGANTEGPGDFLEHCTVQLFICYSTGNWVITYFRNYAIAPCNTVHLLTTT